LERDTKPFTLPEKQPTFPLLALIVSGGHCDLVLFRDHFDYTLLGQTHDDAIGEAFDKVAKIIGLPYPGGPTVEKIALQGDAQAFDFPKAKMTGVSQSLKELRNTFIESRVKSQESRKIASQHSGNIKAADSDTASTLDSCLLTHASAAPSAAGSYDFSFSGLKTAVLRAAQLLIGVDHTFPSKNLSSRLSESQKADIAASFVHTAIETVVDKTISAYQEFLPASVLIAGGVAASPELRRKLAARLPCPIVYTDPRLCTDNGAMVATLGCFHMKHNRPAAEPYSLDIMPNLSM
jgi:N6-L-threonylcarbamoyladenine synthase